MNVGTLTGATLGGSAGFTGTNSVGTLANFQSAGNFTLKVLERLPNLDCTLIDLSANMLADLERYEVVVKLLERGANLEPFRGRTLAASDNRRSNRNHRRCRR